MSERDKESERRIREITDALPVVVYEADEIGKTAEIFETEHDNKQALFITFVEKAEPSRVIQPSAKVIQLDSTKRVKNRLQELESVIKELQSIIFLNESDRLHENRKSKAFTARSLLTLTQSFGCAGVSWASRLRWYKGWRDARLLRYHSYWHRIVV